MYFILDSILHLYETCFQGEQNPVQQIRYLLSWPEDNRDNHDNLDNHDGSSKHLKGRSVPRVSHEIYSQQEILKFSCF